MNNFVLKLNQLIYNVLFILERLSLSRSNYKSSGNSISPGKILYFCLWYINYNMVYMVWNIVYVVWGMYVSYYIPLTSMQLHEISCTNIFSDCISA